MVSKKHALIWRTSDHWRVNRKRLPSRYMSVTRYWHWPIMAVGLADGCNLAEKPSGDLRKWGWNWWERPRLPVGSPFEILFRSRNRSHRSALGIATSINWRHIPTRFENCMCCCEQKIDCLISTNSHARLEYEFANIFYDSLYSCNGF